MKIHQIQNPNLTTQNKSKNGYLSLPRVLSVSNKSSFSPNFGIGQGAMLNSAIQRAWGRIRILERTQVELIDLAESFHKCTEEQILLLCETRKMDWNNNFWESLCKGGPIDITKSEEKYNRLHGAIKEIIEKKSKLFDKAEIKRLDDKAARCPKDYEFEYLFYSIYKPEFRPRNK